MGSCVRCNNQRALKQYGIKIIGYHGFLVSRNVAVNNTWGGFGLPMFFALLNDEILLHLASVSKVRADYGLCAFPPCGCQPQTRSEGNLQRLNPYRIDAIKQGAGRFYGAARMRLFGGLRGRRQGGFTLVELVMTMVVVGILAAVVAPRFFDTDVFRSKGFADQVQATLRYAQKEAIAQHRNVCVAVAAGDITLNIASTSGGASACNTNLASPAGQPTNCPSATYKICTPSAAITITLAPAVPATFSFDALGRPFDVLGTTPSAQKSITVSGAPSIIFVEAETGYVHSP